MTNLKTEPSTDRSLRGELWNDSHSQKMTLIMYVIPLGRYHLSATIRIAPFATVLRSASRYPDWLHHTLTTSQSIPSLMPFPSIAEHATMLQFRSLSSPKRSASDISPAPLAPGWSCLFANTRSAASRSSSSLSIAASSSDAVFSRSMSVESMTNITAAVFV